MDVLVSVATGAAYLFSVIAFALHALDASSDKKEPFFETVCLLITLILAGRWLTARIRSWASEKINTVGGNGPQSTEIRFCNPNTGVETVIQARELHYGDPIIVSQGERIVTDGLVISGTAQTDESHLTGEPKPQKKYEGSYVLAGSKVVSGELRYRVTKLMQENTISRIKGMVKLASQQKPRIQEIADKVASILTPSILFIALVVFMIWLLVGTLQLKNRWKDSTITAATYAIATLAISCPCAIDLAVPVGLVVASRVGVSRGGFVFKNSTAIEKGKSIRKIIFGKTSTLTTGQLDAVCSQVIVDGVW
jgi:P-type E1-E2 ATPase